MFLLSAKKVSRGMAIIKHILILGARMLAIAGLLFAISRPLATGWFGSIAGGKPETVIVVLDRSASMKQQNLTCLLYTSPSPRDATLSRMPSSA